MKKPQKNRPKIVSIDPNQMEFAFVPETLKANQLTAVKCGQLLKSAAGETPNDSGVFERSKPQFEKSCNKRSYLKVWVVELENGMWIWSHHLCLPHASYSTALATYWAYKTRFAAVRAAFQAAYGVLLRDQNTKAGDRLRLRLLKSLLAWMEAENITLVSPAKAA